MSETRAKAIGEGVLASVGLILFGLVVNAPFRFNKIAALPFLALIVAAYIRSLEDTPTAELLALRAPRGSKPVLLFSALFGCGLGFLFRGSYYQHLLPGGLTTVTFLVAAIGAMEELVARGYIQGRFQSLGGGSAALLATIAHTAYKCAMFAWMFQHVDIGMLAVWTLAGGLVFAAMRQLTKSVYPPLLAHAFFDVIVYGELYRFPPWVW